MAGEILAGLSAFKTMYDLAKALKDIDNATSRNAAVIELQEKILAAREAQSALLDRVSELEKEVARFETWESEKKRYKLTDFGGETFAYLLRPEEANGEPSHRICATCYQKNEKSILQFSHRSEGQDWFMCYGCGKRQAFGVYVSPVLDDDYGSSF
jgi:hypothetical protein